MIIQLSLLDIPSNVPILDKLLCIKLHLEIDRMGGRDEISPNSFEIKNILLNCAASLYDIYSLVLGFSNDGTS